MNRARQARSAAVQATPVGRHDGGRFPLVVDRIAPDADARSGMARRMTRDGLALVEDALGRMPYIAGERFAEADITTPFWFTTALRFRPPDLGPCPNLRAHLARIGERPACRRAMALAGPDAAG